ncbi:hypothetical protein BC939DRAFT_287484 [Gamsiella multidivaricata]|uniref:uncharacterized protein n=1 Tax=Gamsiella multidivaricata TaxID=101098 RepID=UPI00221E9726|nr:uncharacterized protein BC939DRAFT_287484 [Gamsiella multidivaricata]KAI7818740.1 hypothetical protein BC939DRAFT_287484 [Gamsiella multidivaricata]
MSAQITKCLYPSGDNKATDAVAIDYPAHSKEGEERKFFFFCMYLVYMSSHSLLSHSFLFVVVPESETQRGDEDWIFRYVDAVQGPLKWRFSLFFYTCRRHIGSVTKTTKTFAKGPVAIDAEIYLFFSFFCFESIPWHPTIHSRPTLVPLSPLAQSIMSWHMCIGHRTD